MLRMAIYCNSFWLLAVTIYFMVKIFSEDADYKKLRRLMVTYLILSIANGYAVDMVDVGFGVMLLITLFVLGLVIQIIGICCATKRIKNSNNSDYNIIGIKKYIVLSILPLIIIGVPFAYELYIVNNYDYMITYDETDGNVESSEVYIAIIDDKAVTVTLNEYDYHREGNSAKKVYYWVANNNAVEIYSDYAKSKVAAKDENVEKLILSVVEKCPSFKDATLEYFPEKKYGVVEYNTEDTHEEKKYFCYDGKCIEIHVTGGLEEIVYYK